MSDVDQVEDAGVVCGFPEWRMDAQHFIELAADRVQRVQRRHRLLEDHADFCATNVAHLVLRRDGKILAFEQDAAAPDAHMRAGQQAKDRTRDERFARSALADQACHFAGAQNEIDIAHRVGAVGAGRQSDRELFKFENSLVHRSRSLGLRASLSPSPMRLIPSTVSRIAMPGKVQIHQAERSTARPALMINPQLMTLGSPRPRNANPASSRIAVPISSEPTAMMEEAQFGSI